MDSVEINNLAKTHADAILSTEMTMAELIMLMACIQARVERAILTPPVAAASTTAPVKAEPPIDKGSIIANKGYPCVCVMCAKHVYTLNRDLYERTTVGEFIESYTPMPGFMPITRKMKISNIENNITTDCPSCGAELGLYLAGKQVNG